MPPPSCCPRRVNAGQRVSVARFGDDHGDARARARQARAVRGAAPRCRTPRHLTFRSHRWRRTRAARRQSGEQVGAVDDPCQVQHHPGVGAGELGVAQYVQAAVSEVPYAGQVDDQVAACFRMSPPRFTCPSRSRWLDTHPGASRQPCGITVGGVAFSIRATRHSRARILTSCGHIAARTMRIDEHAGARRSLCEGIRVLVTGARCRTPGCRQVLRLPSCGCRAQRGRAEPSARVKPGRLVPPAASGLATSSRDLPSASMARKNAISPPATITAAPSRYP